MLLPCFFQSNFDIMKYMANKEIRVRMAPSPTGYAHIGSARTALFNWLFAKHEGGKFILRIEDTDKERSKKEYEDDLLEGFKWMGIDWDEFYRQSDRIPIYSKYIQKLLDEGKAFWCYHSEDELEKERQEQSASKAVPRHVCGYKRQGTRDKGQNEEGGIIRLAVDENSDKKIKFKDLIRGEIEFEERLMGDFSVAKDINSPLYNFAATVDDYEMGSSHVIRGEEHVSNTPRQILIQKALGFESPDYAHLPLLLGTDKSKLSKRNGAASLSEYKKMGYLPEALANFICLLSFTAPDGKEIVTMEELIDIFELSKVHKSGAVFDMRKLDWINGEYIKNLSDEKLAEKILQITNEELQMTKDGLVKVMPLAKERMKKLSDIAEFDFFFKKPEYKSELLKWKERTNEEIKSSLGKSRKVVEETGVDDESVLRNRLDEISDEIGDRGLIYWPLRVALSGQKYSPDPVKIAAILGKEKTLERVSEAIGKL
jgi:glutamyl-tRNA synthetase